MIVKGDRASGLNDFGDGNAIGTISHAHQVRLSLRPLARMRHRGHLEQDLRLTKETYGPVGDYLKGWRRRGFGCSSGRIGHKIECIARGNGRVRRVCHRQVIRPHGEVCQEYQRQAKNDCACDFQKFIWLFSAAQSKESEATQTNQRRRRRFRDRSN